MKLPPRTPASVLSVAPWFGARDIFDFAEAVRNCDKNSVLMDLPSPVSYQEVARLSRDFHVRAGTLNETVSATLNISDNSLPSLAVGHQPNFLASLNVIIQPSVMNQLAHLLNEQQHQFFVIIDFDVASDRRYRHAIFPSPISGKGYHSFQFPRPRDTNSLIMRSERVPTQLAVERIYNLIEQISLQDLAAINSLGLRVPRDAFRQNLYALSEFLIGARDHSSTLSQMNGKILSKLINEGFGLPVAFIEGSRLHAAMAEHFEYLWDKSQVLIDSCREVAGNLEEDGLVLPASFVPDLDWVPFWGACPSGHRFTLFWTASASQKAEGQCKECNFTLRLSKPGVRSAASSGGLIPKIITDDILDCIAWRHSAVCGYRGSLDHHIFSSMVARKVGLRSLPSFLTRRSAEAGFSNIVSASYWEFIRAASMMPNTAAIDAAAILMAGRGSVAHWLLWNDLNDSPQLSQVTRTFIAA